MVQSTVENTALATGIPGESSRGSMDQDSFGAILNSATESLNVVGSFVNYFASEDNQVGVAGDGNLAGMLCYPKAAYRQTLEAQAYLSNDQQVNVATHGYWWTTFTAAAAKGDYVYYSDTTGVIQTQAPGTAPDSGYTRVPGGTVARTVTEAGVGEIYFDVRSGSTETPSA